MATQAYMSYVNVSLNLCFLHKIQVPHPPVSCFRVWRLNYLAVDVGGHENWTEHGEFRAHPSHAGAVATDAIKGEFR